MIAKRIIMSLLGIALLPCAGNARWRIGCTIGETYNDYARSRHYMTDWHYQGAWSNNTGIGTAGLMCQYDFNNWLGLRLDFNWTVKAHREYSSSEYEHDFHTNDSYWQLPVMASFRVGNRKISGFANVGVFGAYEFASNNYGVQGFISGGHYYHCNGWTKNEILKERDHRLDFGLVGGMGLECQFNKHWSWQIVEARIYYSTCSTTHNYMNVKDPRYNTTIAIQSGVCYFF